MPGKVAEAGRSVVSVAGVTTVLGAGFALIFLFDILHGPYSQVGPVCYRLCLGALDQIRQLNLPRLVSAEYSIIAGILLVLYFPRVKNPLLRYALPVVPILCMFAIIDAFFLFLARIPRVSDLGLLDELYAVRWYYGVAAVFALVVPLAGVLLLLYVARRDHGERGFWRGVGLRALAFGGGVVLLLSPAGAALQKDFVPMRWSELYTVQSNGRLSSFFHYARQDIRNNQRLQQFTGFADIAATLFPGLPVRTPNIHLIVLESFIDPRLFENVRYSRSPLADELKPFLQRGGTGFSHIVSPVYGGGTARACFEVLSGLPSLGLVEPIEFNLMRDGKVRAFSWQLANNGYATLATTAATSEYFNEPRAYASLSLDNIRFLADPGSGFAPRPGEKDMFDGDLFDQNLLRLEQQRAEIGDRPLLNYVLGMYGHFPYNRNLERQPDVISDDSGIKDVGKIANQFYYRTRALGRYLARLKADDPNAVVFITADHLPPVLATGVKYRLDKFANSALLLNGWKPVDIAGRHQYEIPWLLWDMLRGSGEGHRKASPAEMGRRETPPADMERLYYTALRQSIDTE